MRPLRLGVDLLPFVPAARRHQAAPLLEGLAIGRRGLDAIGARVDRAVGLLAELVGLQPERHQAPSCHDQLAAVTGRPDDRHDVRRRDVVVGLQLLRRLLRQGQPIEVHDLRPGQMMGVASAHAHEVASDFGEGKPLGIGAANPRVLVTLLASMRGRRRPMCERRSNASRRVTQRFYTVARMPLLLPFTTFGEAAAFDVELVCRCQRTFLQDRSSGDHQGKKPYVKDRPGQGDCDAAQDHRQGVARVQGEAIARLARRVDGSWCCRTGSGALAMPFLYFGLSFSRVTRPLDALLKHD